MVYSRSTHYCGKCNKQFFDWDDADRCERMHIVTDAVEGFRRDLVEIFSNRDHGPRKARPLPSVPREKG